MHVKTRFIPSNTINVGTKPPPSPNNGPLFGGDAHFAGERCIGMLSDPQTIRTNVLYFYYYSSTIVVPLEAQKPAKSNYLTHWSFVREAYVKELSMPGTATQSIVAPVFASNKNCLY